MRSIRHVPALHGVYMDYESDFLGGKDLKGWKMALAFVLALGMCTSAKADLQLYIGKNTVSASQGEALARLLQTGLEEPVQAAMQTDESFSQRMTDGSAPDMAILCADEMRKWANAGMLTALDGCTDTLGEMSEEIVNGCVADESLYALPLGIRSRAMAVHPAWMEKIRMAYLLDERMHAAWYPTEILQALDELALSGGTGLDLWPPQETGTLCFEAFLQGINGAWFSAGETDAGNADLEALEDALVWVEEMVRAELVGTAQSRDEALARFLAGETAIFIDWTMEDSRTYAGEIEDGSIQLLPYPSMSGIPFAAGDVVCFLAPCSGEEGEQRARQAAALLASNGYAQQVLGETLPAADEMDWLIGVNMLEGGATLRALFAQAVGEILAGDIPAREAAKKIGRVLAVTAR